MSHELNIERWRKAWLDANADAEWCAFHSEEDSTRASIVPQMLDLLQRFQSATIDLEAFRSEFDQRTRTDWKVFGLKGLSGAMFLNMLTKYVPDRDEITRRLQLALGVPTSVEDAEFRLQDFMDYLGEVIDLGEARKRELQPARAPFFVSAWWHLQQQETWPIFYQSGRKVLELERAYEPTGNPVQDYFLFRQAFLSLASALEIESWSCEHLLDRCHVPKKNAGNEKLATLKVSKPIASESPIDVQEDSNAPDELCSSHAQIQWLLAKIGEKVGCQIWIASNDRSKAWRGQTLGELSIDALPSLGVDPHTQRIISLIDVVWLKGAKQVVAAFEVEHTTSIFSGLLRLSDLVAECPNLNFPLYLVAPEKRLEKVRKQLSRPTFQVLELHKRCGFFSDEALIMQAEAILQWASEPTVLDQLAETVGDDSRA